MKIYVAAPGSLLYRAQTAIITITEMGHQITYDWTTAYTEEVEECASRSDWRSLSQECADNDFAGVYEADIVILLWDGSTTRGMWCELGYALALKKPVFFWDLGVPDEILRQTIFLQATGVFHFNATQTPIKQALRALDALNEAVSTISVRTHVLPKVVEVIASMMQENGQASQTTVDAGSQQPDKPFYEGATSVQNDTQSQTKNQNTIANFRVQDNVETNQGKARMVEAQISVQATPEQVLAAINSFQQGTPPEGQGIVYQGNLPSWAVDALTARSQNATWIAFQDNGTIVVTRSKSGPKTGQQIQVLQHA